MTVINTTKGRVGEAIVKAVLTSARYRVVPFGVEETVRELAVLEGADYGKLKLPMALRFMPDFFVATRKVDETWLVEVKYRGNWSKSVRRRLLSPLRVQAGKWGNVTLVFVFRRFKDGPAVRCLRVTASPQGRTVDILTKNGRVTWDCVRKRHFVTLKEVFPEVSITDAELTKLLDQQLFGQRSCR